jgi:hypothetical protein
VANPPLFPPSPSHRPLNLASFNLALSAEQVKALDEASRIDPGFPYHFYAKEHVRANAYGGMQDQILA